MKDNDNQEETKDRLFTELIICLLREKELGFKFVNLLVVLHCSSKGIKRANRVLSPVLKPATDDLSLVPGKGQTKNKLSSLLQPTHEKLELSLGNWEYLLALMNQKQNTGGGSPGHLYT